MLSNGGATNGGNDEALGCLSILGVATELVQGISKVPQVCILKTVQKDFKNW